MARPLRVEYEGAVYHITSRGNAKQAIFLGAKDRNRFLEILSRVVERFGWACYAYCLMDNHYHLLIETPTANLSRGMQLLNGMYTQAFNRRHGRAGHVLQGRFKSILVEKESHLLELTRYVVLNPVRAGVVRHPEQYEWSSYRATAGKVEPPRFLSVDWILAQFDRNRMRARGAYCQFVKEGVDASIWDEVEGGILLGTEEFIARIKPLLRTEDTDTEIPKRQRFAGRPSLENLFAQVGGNRQLRAERVHEAVVEHGYTLTALQRHLGLHPSTLSRIVKRLEEKNNAKGKV